MRRYYATVSRYCRIMLKHRPYRALDVEHFTRRYMGAYRALDATGRRAFIDALAPVCELYEQSKRETNQ